MLEIIDSKSGDTKLVRFDITDNCNIRCIMCESYNTKSKNDLNLLDINVFKNMTRGALKNLQVVQIGNVAEPLLHPNFSEFIEYIRSETDACIQILTNGILLDRYIGVINNNDCRVIVSVDSLNTDTYSKIRVGGDLNKVINSVEQLNVEWIYLDQTLMNCNFDEYDTIVMYCRLNGYKFLGRPMCLRASGNTISKKLIDESLWFRKDRIRSWMDKYLGKSFDDTVHSPMAEVHKPIVQKRCTAHEDDLLVRGDGTCILCNTIVIGNLYESDLKSILNSEIAIKARAAINRNQFSQCNTCDYLTICSNPCINNLSNYLTDNIYKTLSDTTIKQISFNSNIPDDVQKIIFMNDLSRNFTLV